MKKTLFVTLILCLGLACAAIEIESIRSWDLSQNANQVVIQLSGTPQYEVQNLPDGNGIRIRIPDATEPGLLPDYPRLSRVLDKISVNARGSDLFIDILTMGEHPIAHNLSDNGRRITVVIGKKPKPAPLAQPVPSAATSMEKPPGDVIEEQEGRFVQNGSISSQADSVAADTLIHAPGTTLPEKPAERAPDTEKTARERRPFISLYVIIGVALILCVWVILRFFRKRKPAEFPDRFVQTPTGSILLLDDDPRIRMAKKLHDQGWDASQIARELKLSVQQVEEIISGEKEEKGKDDA